MKYKLTQEKLEYKGHTLYRIEALQDFSYIKKGDKGGFVESEANLSQDGNCWIGGNAKVYDDAQIYGNAKVYGNAEVYCCAKVYDNGKVYGNARIYNSAWAFGDAEVFDEAWVYGKAQIYGDAQVFENAQAFGGAKIYGNTYIFEDAKIYGDSKIYGNAQVYGDAEVCGYAMVYGDAMVNGNARVKGDAKVESMHDYIVFKNWWSSGRHLTWTRSNNKWSVGCFYGTGEELVEKAYKDNELSGIEYKRLVDYVESIQQNEKGSEKGADQHPKNVWHDASEEPLYKNQQILIYSEDFEYFFTDFPNYLIVKDGGQDKTWETAVLRNKISKWAYVKDILPKGKEQ